MCWTARFSVFTRQATILRIFCCSFLFLRVNKTSISVEKPEKHILNQLKPQTCEYLECFAFLLVSFSLIFIFVVTVKCGMETALVFVFIGFQLKKNIFENAVSLVFQDEDVPASWNFLVSIFTFDGQRPPRTVNRPRASFTLLSRSTSRK